MTREDTPAQIRFCVHTLARRIPDWSWFVLPVLCVVYFAWQFAR